MYFGLDDWRFFTVEEGVNIWKRVLGGDRHHFPIKLSRVPCHERRNDRCLLGLGLSFASGHLEADDARVRSGSLGQPAVTQQTDPTNENGYDR